MQPTNQPEQSAEARQPGWYWITLPKNLQRPAFWDGKRYFYANEEKFYDQQFFEDVVKAVGPRIPSPEELAALQQENERLRAALATAQGHMAGCFSIYMERRGLIGDCNCGLAQREAALAKGRE